MNSERILQAFERKLTTQRYVSNTIRSYRDYASLFLNHVAQFDHLKDVPLSHVESFINDKVNREQISVPYQKGLVGAIKKLYKLLLEEKIKLDYLYPEIGLAAAQILFQRRGAPYPRQYGQSQAQGHADDDL